MSAWWHLGLLCMCSCIPAFANWDEAQTNADLQRQINAKQIHQQSAAQQQFLTLDLAAMTPFVRGTVILVPDWSQHAASPRAVEYLRQILPDYGWNTMSMMVPPAATEQSLENLQQYQTLLKDRLAVLMQDMEKKPGTIVVIGFGHSGAVLNNLYRNEELSAPQALILVGAAVQDPALNDQVALAISQHKVPTLDLLPKLDNAYVASSSRLRLQLVRKYVKEIYRQRILPGSSAQDQAWLGNEVIGWLRYIGY